jgi:rhomboid family GlyGly-CTERM serine protease
VEADQTKGSLQDCKWTLALSAGILLLNLGLLFPAVPQLHDLLRELQFDGTAIRQGEFWRLVTGNLVHWSPLHLYLDGAAFLLLGILYERCFGRCYPCILLVMALVVGLAQCVFWPERSLCRGLSGITAGQFALGLYVEFRLAWRSPRRWLYVTPAAAALSFWLGYGALTGRALFAAAGLPDGVQVASVAHCTGTLTALCWAPLAVILQQGVTILVRRCRFTSLQGQAIRDPSCALR